METQYIANSTLLRYFRSIEPGAYLHIMDFFESYETEIQALEVQEYIIILSYYIDALYEVGDYEKEVIYYTEILLEQSIIENIQFVDGQDIYMRALLQRAVSFLQINDFNNAYILAKQLYRLAPNDSTCQRLIKDCLLLNKPKWILKALKYSIVFAALAVFIKISDMIFAFGNIGIALILISLLMSCTFSLSCLYGQYKYIQKPMKAILK